MQVRTIEAEGTQVEGIVGGKPLTAAVYLVRLNKQFVSLIYIRNHEADRAQTAWELLRTTIKLDDAAMSVQPTSASSGILNGRAIELPPPQYPSAARFKNQFGIVSVRGCDR